MEYFEGIIKTLLEHEGYWVRQSFKVNLTKQEKREIGKSSLPRPEIDLLAFKPSYKEVLILEAKSYLDSPGVRLSELQNKLKYRKADTSSLLVQIIAILYSNASTKIYLSSV